MSSIFRTRIPPALVQELRDFCAQWRLTPSRVLRLGLRYLLDHPEVLATLLPQPIPVVDLRTEAERENSDRYMQAMEEWDMQEVLQSIVREG